MNPPTTDAIAQAEALRHDPTWKHWAQSALSRIEQS